MKKLKVLIESLWKTFNTLAYSLLPIPASFLIRDVPFYSQWESKELVDDILSKKIAAKEDPRWKESGAKSDLEYELWSWNLCGMACFKMVLTFMGRESVSIITLGKMCEKYGGYKVNKSTITI